MRFSNSSQKAEFAAALEGIGLDFTSAVRSYAFQLARCGVIPFEVRDTGSEPSGETVVATVKVPEDAAAGACRVLDGMGIGFSAAVRMLALQTMAEDALPPQARGVGQGSPPRALD